MKHGEQVVRDAAAAFNAGDADAFAARAHPDFLFVPLLTRNPAGEPYRGRDGARQYVLDAHRWSSMRVLIDHVDDHGDVVLARARLAVGTGDEDSRTLSVVYVARVRDGLVAEMATLADVSQAAAAFGVEPVTREAVLDLNVDARPANIPAIRAAAREFAASRGIDDLHPVELAVTEAATNVVVHAYADRPEPGPIVVTGREDPHGILISVADEGSGLVPRPDSPGLGLGLAVMSRVAAEISFVGPPQRESGTEVRLRFARA